MNCESARVLNIEAQRRGHEDFRRTIPTMTEDEAKAALFVLSQQVQAAVISCLEDHDR